MGTTLNKNNSFTGNLFRCAAVVLTAIIFFNNSVKADESMFHSDISDFSVSIPDGYEYAGVVEGNEVFINDSTDNLQYMLVSFEKNSGVTDEMLKDNGDTYMENILASYGSDGGVMSDEQSYGYREYGEYRKGWLGFGVVKDGEHVDMFLMCNNQSDLYSVVFVDVTEDARMHFINSFVPDNFSNDTGFSSSAEIDYTIPSIGETDSNSSEMVPYTLKNGTYKLLVPSMYDVLIKGQDISKETASSHGLTQEQLTLYLRLSSEDLIAVLQNEPMPDCDTIRLKIKEDKYSEVENLKDFSSFEKKIIADGLITGMNNAGMNVSDGYELYETGDVCFIVFECKPIYPEIRYATIIDEDMIYLYYKADGTGEINEEIRTKMKKIADTFSYEG